MARRIVELGGAGKRCLGHGFAAKEMVHRIGDEQESIGEFQDLRTQQQIRVELAERIDRHELNAGRSVDLFTGDLPEAFVGAVRPLVTILIWGSQKGLGTLQQSIVHPPGIGTERADRQAPGPGIPQPLHDLGIEVEQIPAARSLDHHRAVGKSVQLLKGEAAILERAQHDAAAFGTKINGEVVGVGHKGKWVRLKAVSLSGQGLSIGCADGVSAGCVWIFGFS